MTILSFRIPLKLSLPLPGRLEFPLIFLFLLGSQPLGSPAALVLFIGIAGVVCLFWRIPFLPMGNFLLVAAAMVLASLVNFAFSGVNLLMTAFYVGYLSLMLACGLAIIRRTGALEAARKNLLIFWILLGDLAVNGPAVALQLLLSGPGDMVTGLSGLLIKESLSQNRTNSMRAGFLVILCLANLKSGPKRLIGASLAFNGMVLLLATSMTTIFSAIAATGIFLFLRMNMIRFLPFGLLGVGLAILADRINQIVFKSPSVFLFLAEINTRWIPKLDIYGHFFGEMVLRNPFALWVGEGIGNFSNRFSMLANFQAYSRFPFKEQVSSLFYSPDAVEHLVTRYGLEKGVVGSSIISVPWGGILSLLTEWGLLGLALLATAGTPWLARIWRERNSGTYQLLLVLFLFLNLFFDCYLDYPEVLIPFIVILAILSVGTLPNRHKDGAEANPVKGANQRRR